MIKQLFKQSGIFFFGSLLSKAVVTIAWVALARVLSPDRYGQFTLYFLILQITTFIGDFGLIQWYFKKVSADNRVLIFNKIISARTLTLIATLVCLSGLIYFFSIFDGVTSLILIASLIPMAYLSIADAYFLELKKSFKVSQKLTSIGLIFLLGYSFIYEGLDLQKSVLILLFSLLFTLIWFFPWSLVRLNEKTSFNELFNILKSAASYLYLTLTSFFYNRGDSFVISYSLGNYALGIYGLAYRFLESLALFSTSMTQNLFPVSAKKEGLKQHEVEKISLIMLFIGCVTALFIFLTADFLISGLFGQAYQAGVSILRIFSLVLILFFVNAPLATVVQSSSLVNKFLPYGISNTLLNIVLNLIFIPIYGITAAAWIMVVTEFTGLIINLFFINKLYN